MCIHTMYVKEKVRLLQEPCTCLIHHNHLFNQYNISFQYLANKILPGIFLQYIFIYTKSATGFILIAWIHIKACHAAF